MSLRLADYRVSLHGRDLAHITATAEPAAPLCLMGPSGVGKSSVLLGIAGLLPVPLRASGRVTLNGRELLSLPPERRRAGMMLQAPLLYPHMSVLGNVLFAVPLRETDGTRRKREVRRALALKQLARVDLADLAGRDPATLSGGQKSRVALARTLAAEPEALLLDEPFSALDRSLRAEVREMVFALARRDGLPVVLVSHDPDDAHAARGTVLELSHLPSTDSGLI